ncbi:unnamed protein product [Ceratitis capitata]|uniref:(Mediterranean fruit fly) hypothetical protein n=1 Tax=Ceratitis capitata TaxID=7213 RepID=A0A811VD57_CERCA|nr:unnamed protein product [Ceratitis capitata]
MKNRVIGTSDREPHHAAPTDSLWLSSTHRFSTSKPCDTTTTDATATSAYHQHLAPPTAFECEVNEVSIGKSESFRGIRRRQYARKRSSVSSTLTRVLILNVRDLLKVADLREKENEVCACGSLTTPSTVTLPPTRFDANKQSCRTF